MFTGSSIAWKDITGGTHRKVATGDAYNGSMTATVRAVSYGPREGRKVKVLGKRSRLVRNTPCLHARRGVGSALFGSSEDTSCQAVGFDAPLFESKLEFERWAQGQDKARCGLSDKLLALGKRAAQRQRRRILNLRGVAPSDTSVEDAAADAVLAILTHVRKLHKITAAQWESYRLVKVLSMYAGRGAFNSLTAWAGLGMRGANHAQFNGQGAARLAIGMDGRVETGKGGFDWLGDLTTAAFVELQAADESAPGAREQDHLARWAAARWVFRVGWREFGAGLPCDMRGGARAAAMRAARSRCRVVGEIIYGASMVDACAVSGYDSVKAFAQSCDAAGFWQGLQAARHGDSLAGLGQLWRMRDHAQRAAAAIKTMRSIGCVAVREVTSGGNVRAGMASSRRGNLLALRQAEAARAFHLAQAVLHRNQVQREMAAERQAFACVMRGVRTAKFGNLRSVVGLTRKHKARSGKRLNPLGIGAARGKVRRQVHLAATVPVTVNGRNIECARLAPSSVRLLTPYVN